MSMASVADLDVSITDCLYFGNFTVCPFDSGSSRDRFLPLAIPNKQHISINAT
jgi:hypothetical protein